MKKISKRIQCWMVILAVFTAIIIPFTSVSAELMDELKICEKLGIIRGGSSGITSEYLSQVTKKYQAALISLRLRGSEVEKSALEYVGENNFPDADQVNWINARNMMAFLKDHSEYGWKGDTKGYFNPMADITPQMYYKVMLEALNYQLDTGNGGDYQWTEVLSFAKDLGMYRVAELEKMTNWDIAIATVEALQVEVKDSGITLTEKLYQEGVITYEEGVETGLLEPAVTIYEYAQQLDYGEVEKGTYVTLESIIPVTYSNGIEGEEKVLWEAEIDTSTLGEKRVIGKVEGTDLMVEAIAWVVYPPLQVVSASAENASEVLLQLNREAVGLNVEDITQYTVISEGVEKEVTCAVLSEDQQTVSLTLLDFLEEGKSFIVKVGTGVGILEELQLSGYYSSDTTSPSIQNVEVFGGKIVKIVFSEPVVDANEISNYRIDGIQPVGSIQSYGKIVLITLEQALTLGTHTFSTAMDIVDFAGLKLNQQVYSVPVNSDTVAPTATVLYCTQTLMKVKFSEPIEILRKIDFRITPLAFPSKIIQHPDLQTFTLEFREGSIISKDGALVVMLAVTDIAGNQKNIRTTVKPEVDDAVPVYKGYVIENQNKMVLNFSESVASTGAVYQLTGQNSETITLVNRGWYQNKAGTTYENRIILQKEDASDFEQGRYMLVMKGVKDLSPQRHELEEHTTTIEVNDQVKPKIVSIKTKINRLVIEFSEALDANSINEIGQYGYIDNAYIPSALPMGTTIDFGVDEKTLTIVLPQSFDIKKIQAFNVSGICDKAGNRMEMKAIPASQFEFITAVASVKSAAVIGKNTILLEMGSELHPGTLNVGDFIVKSGDELLTATRAEYNKKNGSILLSIAEDLHADGTYLSADVSVQLVKQPVTSDIFGQKLAGSMTYKALDKYAPEVINIELKENGEYTDIILYFNDNIMTTNGSGKQLVSDMSELNQFIILVEEVAVLPTISRYDDAKGATPAKITLQVFGKFVGADVKVMFYPNATNRLSDDATIPNSVAAFEL